ncbi:hypothetical protein [Rubritalea tangerina]|uniref:hypothetical protein n=1 Tax=Rubritalea tangerina TaxID=430798 RepID=UPI00361F8179
MYFEVLGLFEDLFVDFVAFTGGSAFGEFGYFSYDVDFAGEGLRSFLSTETMNGEWIMVNILAVSYSAGLCVLRVMLFVGSF